MIVRPVTARTSRIGVALEPQRRRPALVGLGAAGRELAAMDAQRAAAAARPFDVD
jgi:hypothetical protein